MNSLYDILSDFTFESLFDDAAEETPIFRYCDVYKGMKIEQSSAMYFTPSMIQSISKQYARVDPSALKLHISKVIPINWLCNYIWDQEIREASISHIPEFKEWFGTYGYNNMYVWYKKDNVKVMLKSNLILHVTFK